MNLYLLSQHQNNWYDTFDSLVVAAKDEESARNIKPSSRDWGCDWAYSPDQVTVEFIGKAIKGTLEGVVLSSFNAG